MKVKGSVKPWNAYRSLESEGAIGIQISIELSDSKDRDGEKSYRTTWRFDNFESNSDASCPIEYMTELRAFERILEYQTKHVFEQLEHAGGGHYFVSYDGLISDTYRRMATNKKKWSVNDVSDLARAFTWMFDKLATAAANEASGRTRSIRTDERTGDKVYFDRAYTPPRRVLRKKGAPLHDRSTEREITLADGNKVTLKKGEPPPNTLEGREIELASGGRVTVPTKVYLPVTSKQPDYIVRVPNDLGPPGQTVTEITDLESKKASVEYERSDNFSDHEELFIVRLGNARASLVIQQLVARLESFNDPQHDDVLTICKAVLENPDLLREGPSGCGWRRGPISKVLGWESERVDRALDFFRSRTRDLAPGHKLLGAESFDEAVHPALSRIH